MSRAGTLPGRTGAVLLLVLVSLLLTACTMPSRPVPGAVGAVPLPAALRLEVAIVPPVPDPDLLAQARTTPAVRRAEAIHVARQVQQTLIARERWTAVRIVPDEASTSDLTVSGRLLVSDGRELALALRAVDASGREWLADTYRETCAITAYYAEARTAREPFAALYARFADDLEAVLLAQSATTLASLRETAALRFAADFAPALSDAHLRHAASDGRYALASLPAENDPQWQRVLRIRARDQRYLDTLQHFYADFAERFSQPYDSWRARSYGEAETRRRELGKALASTVGGALAMVGGALAQSSDNPLARSAGMLGLLGGAWFIGDGVGAYDKAQRQSAILNELAASLDADIAPQTVDLGARVVELRGSVVMQYAEWRALLGQLHALEQGHSMATDL